MRPLDHIKCKNKKTGPVTSSSLIMREDRNPFSWGQVKVLRNSGPYFEVGVYVNCTTLHLFDSSNYSQLFSKYKELLNYDSLVWMNQLSVPHVAKSSSTSCCLVPQ